MPNWDNIKETQGKVPVGQYKVSIINIITTDDIGGELTTANNDTKWNLHLHVEQGKYQGAIIYDQLIFGEKTLPRVKYFGKKFGLTMDGDFELAPDMLIGRIAYCTVEEEMYNDKLRNKVPWAGYERVSVIEENGNIETEPTTPSTPSTTTTTQPTENEQHPTDAPPLTDSDHTDDAPPF